VGTLAAPLIGAEERTVGSADVPPGAPTAPGRTVTPGKAVALALPPPPPQPTIKAVRQNAVNHRSGLNASRDLFIYFSRHVSPLDHPMPRIQGTSRPSIATMAILSLVVLLGKFESTSATAVRRCPVYPLIAHGGLFARPHTPGGCSQAVGLRCRGYHLIRRLPVGHQSQTYLRTTGLHSPHCLAQCLGYVQKITEKILQPAQFAGTWSSLRFHAFCPICSLTNSKMS
jgi:hypothetical protein